MDCGGSVHKMQQGGSHRMPDGSMMRNDAMQQGGAPTGGCTGENFGGQECPPGSPQYEIAKSYKQMASKREKKDFSKGVAEQNMDTDGILAEKNAFFKNHLSQNTMDAISQEETINFGNQQQEQAMANYFQTGGGYVGNPQLDAFLDKNQQLQDANASANQALWGAMENTNFNRELKSKSKFRNTALGNEMKQQYKDDNREYKHMMRNPLDAYTQQMMQTGGVPLPKAQAGNQGEEYAWYDYIPRNWGDLGNTIAYAPGMVNRAVNNYVQNAVGSSSVPAGYIQPNQGKLNHLPAGNGSARSSTQPTGLNPTGTSNVGHRNGKVNQGSNNTGSTSSKGSSPSAGTTTNDAASKVQNSKKVKKTGPVTGNANPNADAGDAQQQGAVQTPYGVVYPNMGRGRGQMPFLYNPNNTYLDSIDTRRALFKGNRAKRINFTHSLPNGQQNFQPQQQQQTQTQPLKQQPTVFSDQYAQAPTVTSDYDNGMTEFQTPQQQAAGIQRPVVISNEYGQAPGTTSNYDNGMVEVQMAQDQAIQKNAADAGMTPQEWIEIVLNKRPQMAYGGANLQGQYPQPTRQPIMQEGGPIETYEGADNYGEYQAWNTQNDAYLANKAEQDRLTTGGYSDGTIMTADQVQSNAKGFDAAPGTSYMRYKTADGITPNDAGMFSESDTGYDYVPYLAKPEGDYNVIENPEVTAQNLANQQWATANSDAGITGYTKSFYNSRDGVQHAEYQKAKYDQPNNINYVNAADMDQEMRYGIIGGAPQYTAPTGEDVAGNSAGVTEQQQLMYGGVPFHEMYPQAARYPLPRAQYGDSGNSVPTQDNWAHQANIENNPNANAKGRFLNDFSTHQVNQFDVVDYNNTDTTGTLKQKTDGIWKSKPNGEKELDYYKNQGTYTNANLKNGVSVEFEGTVNDNKKMLRKMNRDNWGGAHGFRGKGWKDDVVRNEGQSQRAAVKEARADDKFFERGRKRTVKHDLVDYNNKNGVAQDGPGYRYESANSQSFQHGGAPQYQQGGEYELTDDQIQYILANGGSVEYL